MKKTGARVSAAMAEPMTGSPSVTLGGIDIGTLYIDMLCEKFKNRGIKTGLSEAKSAEIRKNAEKLGIRLEDVSAMDEKYRTLKVDGKTYMSSEDFAAYYKDLRGYKLPSFATRAENEYKEAEAAAKSVQESGKPPKKALWLAVKRRVKDGVKDFFSVFVVEEFRKQSEEEVVEGKTKRIPRGVLSTMLIVTLSLMLIVSSTVMVSRASSYVSGLEYEIEQLQVQKNDLDGKLIETSNMIEIKQIAVNEYGMISGDYATSKFLDVAEDEYIVIYGEKAKEDNVVVKILKAIGFIKEQ